jgi:hypothetical protein
MSEMMNKNILIDLLANTNNKPRPTTLRMRGTDLLGRCWEIAHQPNNNGDRIKFDLKVNSFGIYIVSFLCDFVIINIDIHKSFRWQI